MSHPLQQQSQRAEATSVRFPMTDKAPAVGVGRPFRRKVAGPSGGPRSGSAAAEVGVDGVLVIESDVDATATLALPDNFVR